jgi:hypothetical protein
MHIRYKPQVAALAVGGLLAWAGAAQAQYPPVFVPANPYPVGWSYPAVMPQANYYPVLTPVYPSPTPAVSQEPAKQDKETHHLVAWPFNKKPCPTCTDAEQPAVKAKEMEPGKKDPPKVDLPKVDPPKVDQPPQEPAFQPEQAAAGGGEGFAFSMGDVGGYIDGAIPRTRFRLRYDAGFDMNRPDRAEFFYASWKELSFHGHAVQGTGKIFFDPNARGPIQLPGKVDYQEVSSYLEYAFNRRFSAFLDVPVRIINLRNVIDDEVGAGAGGGGNEGAENPDSDFPFNTSGLSDMQVGFKAALIASPTRFLTFQLRTYIPTGDADKGLGTGHVSLEPGLLLYQGLTDRLMFQGQLRAWVPIGGGPAAGNILIYGVGFGYDVYRRGNLHVVPVTEFVGWTVLNGFETVSERILTPLTTVPLSHGVEDASGDTIVNGKFGVRTYFGQKQDVYVGYGHSLTGDRWYRDMFRLEYRFSF